MDENEKLWKTILGEIELSTSLATFKTFFLPSKIESIEDGIILIKCPSSLARERIETRFYTQIQKIAQRYLNENIELQFIVGSDEKTNGSFGPLFSPPQKIKSQEKTGLYPDYTFSNYVVGPSNRLAHAVAGAIAQNPGKVYNPFFLYSKVGLGKTHLVQAIGHQVLSLYPDKKVIYISGESFTNELIEVIQSRRRMGGTTQTFRKKYRNVDVLIIDDIQFIAGKESTQEEFFNTFNALYMEKKQIVLTSDRPPSEIEKLEARLSSRFASGMMADIQQPELETRIAILRKKRDKESLPINDEVLNYIAQNIESNIRELGGALLQIGAFAKTSNALLTVDTAKEILKNRIKEKKRVRDVSMSDVIRMTANYYNLKINDLTGKSRIKNVALARQVAMYLLRDVTEASLMAVGTMLGGRDHSTILHGEAKIKKILKSDEKIMKDVLEIKKQLER